MDAVHPPSRYEPPGNRTCPPAGAAYERALAILVKFLPPGHPTIRIVQDNLDSLP